MFFVFEIVFFFLLSAKKQKKKQFKQSIILIIFDLFLPCLLGKAMFYLNCCEGCLFFPNNFIHGVLMQLLCM